MYENILVGVAVIVVSSAIIGMVSSIILIRTVAADLKGFIHMFEVHAEANRREHEAFMRRFERIDDRCDERHPG